MYLYTSGQSNRVKVTSVLSGSPAETIGLQSEDVILAYDGQRIMRWRDIRSATLQGDIGNYVDIEVLRDGSRLNFTVPTGTLGVQLAGVQQEPENQP
jgi:serine protease Do